MNMSVPGAFFREATFVSDEQAAPSGVCKPDSQGSAPLTSNLPKSALQNSLLTDKQRQVLDLLIQHKTSKEISRALGISSHTVDQRIMLSRTKLGVASRSEVAQAYRRLLAADGLNDAAQPSPSGAQPIYYQSVYGSPYVATNAFAPQERDREDVVLTMQNPLHVEAALPQALQSHEAERAGYYHVLPEKFDGPYGTYLRLGAIALIAVFLILIIMGGLAMFAQLSQILDR